MAQVIIENPVLNSPYEEPRRHFYFSEEGITDKIVDTRRASSYFVPIPRPKKRGKQLVLDTEWTEDRIKENDEINRIRARVGLWRQAAYPGVTRATQQLLEYWQRPGRERRLFFCQIEALETAIYATELAPKSGDAWIENWVRKGNEDANPGLYRIAFKMATGSGKTVVMAMLISWHTLNKLANPQDGRFSDTFLVATPGITIRDRLRVLLPNDPGNYYRVMDIVPDDQRQQMEQAKIVITNFHAFQLRERVDASKLTKEMLAQGEPSAFLETPGQMVRRLCRGLGGKKNIVVINDEAHHCYRRKPDGEEEKLSGDERKEVENRNKQAKVWISGLEAVKKKIGVKAIYDLSATPFFLRGSGYREATLFPWVVSDFSLIDAIESGIVKVPRVPVADDSMTGALPTYRELWLRIRDHLPKKGRRTEAVSGEPKLPAELEGALQSLYSNYKNYYADWEANTEARARGLTPPVFIVVCNNTNVSKLVCDYIAGYEKPLADGTAALVSGKLSLFSNVADGQWLARPNTVLIDSEQLESGEAMSDEFKKIAGREIEEFKEEYRRRFPGRDSDKLSDEDLLREVLNTVGKEGKLGEQVKCVVSVSMLTEGWDANTVTHILGVRAFGTQLLCEQVVGRGLRRMSYATNPDGRFEPEYAEVYGVPFSFIPCAGTQPSPTPGPPVKHIRAMADRSALEIAFPRLLGYRYDLPEERLSPTFSKDSRMVLSTADIPTRTENAPIVGTSSLHTLDEIQRRRVQEVDFELAKLVLENYFRDDENRLSFWLFPQLLRIARRWREECVGLKDRAFPQMLLLKEIAYQAAERIHRGIVMGTSGRKTLKPILRPYDPVGSTRWVDFDTTRSVYTTRADKSHVNYVVVDSEHWEPKTAAALEDMDEVLSYVKNDHLGFTIPYTLAGEEHQYTPDYLVRIDDGRGPADPLNLIVEVSGEARKDKAVKVATARDFWVTAVNNHGGYGRWAIVEITDPWNAQQAIRAALAGRAKESEYAPE
jgi:type III restriction enzyme